MTRVVSSLILFDLVMLYCETTTCFLLLSSNFVQAGHWRKEAQNNYNQGLIEKLINTSDFRVTMKAVFSFSGKTTFLFILVLLYLAVMAVGMKKNCEGCWVLFFSSRRGSAFSNKRLGITISIGEVVLEKYVSKYQINVQTVVILPFRVSGYA